MEKKNENKEVLLIEISLPCSNRLNEQVNCTSCKHLGSAYIEHKLPTTKKMHLVLPYELYLYLKARAKEEGCSMSHIATQIVRKELKRHPMYHTV